MEVEILPSESLLSPAVHPLFIPHILEYILDRISLPCLVNCRQVSKQLNETATKLYRQRPDSKSEMVFDGKDGDDDLSSSDEDEGPRPNEKMIKFLQDFDQSFDNPFLKYKFESTFFLQDNAQLFKSFLFSCTEWIVQLRLSFDNRSTMRFGKRCFPKLILKSLDYLHYECRTSDSLDLTYPLEALLNACNGGKLTRCFFSITPKYSILQQTVIQRFGDLIADKLPPTVVNLKLEMKITNKQLESLLRLGLKLEVLHFDFRGSDLNEKGPSQFLSQQRTTLLEMSIRDSETKYDFSLKFPRFEKLTVLEIQGGTTTHFKYLETFPKLERLMLYGWNNPHTLKSMINPVEEDSEDKCSSLKALELPYKLSDPEVISLASKRFPNLTQLQFTFVEESIKVLKRIWQCLPTLEELEITFPFIIPELDVDEVFTGIDEDDCDKIMEEVARRNLTSGNLPEGDLFRFLQYRKGPSIAQLEKLKKLTIQDHCGEVTLTEITVWFGLMLLPNLSKLEMPKFQIRDDVFEALKNKVELTVSYVSDCEDSSDEDESTSSSSSPSSDTD